MDSFLQEYQRHPKLFIDLPSGGRYYDGSVIQDEQYVQIPVFGMNAMDEIMFKTPDALFSGEATAQVIKSCIPAILDPWKLVGFDIDYVLIAIRVATYGDELPTITTCPHCKSESETTISLTKMLENYNSYETEANFTIGDLTFHLHPITYKQMTDFSIENYTNERTLLQISGNASLTDDQKNTMTKDLYMKISTLNLEVAVSYLNSITKMGQEEKDKTVIKEFVINNDAEFYNKLKDGITELSLRWKTPKVQVTCVDEECNKEFQSSIDLDYSNFFGLKFLHSRNLIS